MQHTYLKHAFLFLGRFTISLMLARHLESLGIRVLPGWKLCSSCKSKADVPAEYPSENEADEVLTNEDEPFTHIILSLESWGESPINLHSVALHQRVASAKKKYKKSIKRLVKI